MNLHYKCIKNTRDVGKKPGACCHLMPLDSWPSSFWNPDSRHNKYIHIFISYVFHVFFQKRKIEHRKHEKYYICILLVRYTKLTMCSIIMLMKNASIHFSARSIFHLDLCCKLQRTAMCKQYRYNCVLNRHDLHSSVHSLSSVFFYKKKQKKGRFVSLGSPKEDLVAISVRPFFAL